MTRPILTGAIIALFLGFGAPLQAQTKDEIGRMIIAEAKKIGGVPVALALAVAQAESDFDPKAESPVGARGVMQIMPATAELEFSTPAESLWDAGTNIRLGLAYLKQLHGHYGGRWDLALSHYNGGTIENGNVHDYTKTYIRKVMALAGKYQRNQVAAGLDREMAGPVGSVTQAQSGDPGFWMLDEIAPKRPWRDYLKVADYWLNPADHRPVAAIEQKVAIAEPVAVPQPEPQVIIYRTRTEWGPPPHLRPGRQGEFRPPPPPPPHLRPHRFRPPPRNR